MKRQRFIILIFALLIGSVVFSYPNRDDTKLFRVIDVADAQNVPYFQGKTIRLIVGTTTGGGYDRWARFFARYMPKYIPGNPEIIVQNMPGASGMTAVNYIYKVVKPDGLTLGMTPRNMAIDQLAGVREVNYDVRKLHWIGTPAKGFQLFYVRADSPYKSIEDILKAQEPPKCGNTASDGATYVLAKILEETLGAKLTIVSGYLGGNEADLAVEKGEVACRGVALDSHFTREPFLTWHKKDFDRHIFLAAPKRDPRMPETPTLSELMEKYKTPDNSRRVARVLLASADFGWPIVSPPGTPNNLIKIFRDAYDKAARDPELSVEVKKLKLELDPSKGEELQTLAAEVLDQPPDVIRRVKNILGN
jgi:tripartite-type tricarboxylate transporter receptor subunit TctC